ncbi:MAG: FHA domain-containing protein [bacterium]
MPDEDKTRVSKGGGPPEESMALPARLSIERRMGKTVNGEVMNLLFGSQLLVGRDQSCEINLPEDRISRKHLLIRIDPDAVRLSDLGSTNGTTRNGEQVTEEIIVESGDVVCMGQSQTFQIRIVEREGMITSVRMARESLAYLLAPQELIIGRADEKNRDVDFMIYDPDILPRHARIEYFTGQVFLISLDEEKPAIVNSNPVREAELRHNQMIELGNTLMRFERLD